MSTGQLFIAVGVPILALLIGFVLQSRHYDARLDDLRGEMRAGFADIKGQITHLIDLHINHESRISRLEERGSKAGE